MKYHTTFRKVLYHRHIWMTYPFKTYTTKEALHLSSSFSFWWYINLYKCIESKENVILKVFRNLNDQIIGHILRSPKLYNEHVYLLETNAYINIVISYHITPMFVRKGLVFQLTVKWDTSLFLVISFLTCYKIFMSDYIIFYHPLWRILPIPYYLSH